MEIDHEARKHKVPRSKVAGEAERAEAEDRSGKLQEVLEDARATVAGDDDADNAPDREDDEPVRAPWSDGVRPPTDGPTS